MASQKLESSSPIDLSSEKDSDTEKESPIELTVAYYQHQYDRVAKLEEHRLAVGNFAIAVSAALLTFSLTTNNPGTQLGASIVLVAVNIFAIQYGDRTIVYLRTHKKRAKHILQTFAPKIRKMDTEIVWEKSPSLWKAERAIHIGLCVVALIPLALSLMFFDQPLSYLLQRLLGN